MKAQTINGADVLFESGSNRIVSVTLKGVSSTLEESNRALRAAVHGHFLRDGTLDSDEQKFLELIDDEVVEKHAFVE